MSALCQQFKRDKDNYQNSPVFQKDANVLYSVLQEHQGGKKWGNYFVKGQFFKLNPAADESEEKHYRFTEN